jgi:hypothetical protein
MALNVMCKISNCYYKYVIPEVVKPTWYTFQKMFVYATTHGGTAQTSHKDRSLPLKQWCAAMFIYKPQSGIS